MNLVFKNSTLCKTELYRKEKFCIKGNNTEKSQIIKLQIDLPVK